MSANKEEALRCLKISRSKHESGNISAAIKFANKSISLHETQDGKEWLEFLSTSSTSTSTTTENEADSGETKNEGKGKSTFTEKTTSQTHSEGVRQRRGPAGKVEVDATVMDETESTTRKYTKEQEKAVNDIIKNKTDYYKVLGLAKDCEENDIKRSYKKMALKFHPDKCAAPRTDEAFRIIAQAFDVLYKADSRAHYDRFGAEQPRRGSAGPSASPFAASAFGGGRYDTPFETEIDPEMLFNMFFNNMGGGFGGPGVRVRSFGSRPGFHFSGRGFQQGGRTPREYQQFGEQTPDYAFRKSYSYGMNRETGPRGVSYYVNKNVWDSWSGSSSQDKINKYERDVEYQYEANLSQACEMERERQRRMIQDSYGFFSVNEARLREAKEMKLVACDKLKNFKSTPIKKQTKKK